MFSRLRTRIFLMVLPSVDTLLDKVSATLIKLDKLTTTLDKQVENEVVKLAKLGQTQRQTQELVTKFFDGRTSATLSTIDSTAKRAAQAAEARDRVASVLGQ